MRPIRLVYFRRVKRRRKDGGGDATDALSPDLRAREKSESGIWGEGVAAEYARSVRGLKIVGRRVRLGRRGEIDIIARDRDSSKTVVFIEVKTRSSHLFGGGLAAVDARKRHALCRAAARYMRRLPPPAPPFRFDVVEVTGEPEDKDPEIRYVENAFPFERRYAFGFLHRWLSR